MSRSQLSILKRGEIPVVPRVATPLTQVVSKSSFRFSWWLRVAHVTTPLMTDMAALLAAAALGYLLWAHPVLQQPLYFYTDLLILLFLFPLGYAGARLYPGFGLGVVETIRRLFCCTSFAFLCLAAASFVLKLPSHHSRITLTIAWAASLVLVPLSRFFALSAVSRWKWWGEPVVLVGSGAWVQHTLLTLRSARLLGYLPVGILSSDMLRGRMVDGVPVLGGPGRALHLAKRGVRVALVEDEDQKSFSLSLLQQYFQQVLIIKGYGNLPVERVHARNLGGILGVEFNNNLLRWHNCLIKRTLDIVLGSILLLLALPLIALGGVLMKPLSPGPVFFCQGREGKDGRFIRIWKIRTMYQDAEKRLEEHLAVNPELRREWDERCKLTHDPRIIPGVGQLLRRLSIDELPQLWSVVNGEMSLVGPRPFPEYHLRRFPQDFRELRQRVRPGLTGMWQVTVRSNGGLEEQKLYDAHYIRNWSIWLDLYILARTVSVVLAGRGAC